MMGVKNKETGEVSKQEITLNKDEGNRPETTLEGLAKLEPVRGPEKIITAGNSSQLSDGASVCVVMSSDLAQQRGLQPLGRYMGMAVAGTEPDEMGIGPVFAVPKLLKRFGLTMDDIGLWELNEAFAVQVLYCQDKLGIRTSCSTSTAARSRSATPTACQGRASPDMRSSKESAEVRSTCGHDVRRRRHGSSGTVRSAIVVAIPLRGESMAFLFWASDLRTRPAAGALAEELRHQPGVSARRAVPPRPARPDEGAGMVRDDPFIDRVVRVDQRIITYQLETQETITRDGVAVRVNAVLWFRAESPVQVVTSVEDWKAATVQAAETALRDAIGQSELDLMLKDRASINHRLQQLLREASLKWGVEIDSVEIKDVDIPEQMQRAIAKEAEAIREKRARIIRAEGEQEAAAKLSEARKR